MSVFDQHVRLRHFQQLFSASSLAAYICDGDGNIIYHNHAAVALWGQSPAAGNSQQYGTGKMYFPDGRSMPMAESPVARTLRTGDPQEGEEVIIERPDRSFRNVLVHSYPVF